MDFNEKSLSKAVASDLSQSSKGVHDLLRGGKPNYENKLFSESQMEALTALCDALVPSLDLDGITNSNNAQDNDELRSFYGVSASSAGIPDYFAGYMSERLMRADVGLMKLALWLLSTWFGTFILCGRLSLCSHFPFFRRFSHILQHRREEILLSWSQSYWYMFRLLFKSIKFLCCLAFYTKVDEKNENPSWRAIGYCGPDPEVSKNMKITRDSDGPLHDKVIDLDLAGDNIINTLRNAGCTVIEGCSQLERLWKGRMRRKSDSRKKQSITIKCDVVIVGSGTGGGVVAGVLAKAGYKVLVLEKGKYFARNKLSLLEGPSLDQMYEGGGLLATDDLGVVLLAGSTVGGGSCVNWSASIRTPEHVIREWSDNLKLSQFATRQYTEAMDIVCRRMGVQEKICSEGFMNKILRKGCQELGYPVNNIPRNASSDHFCGWCCFGCKDGKKQGTNETWLVDAVSSNGVILSGCKAIGVVQEEKRNDGKRKKRAVGVVFQAGKGSQNIYVESKVTVVACGAVCSPGLLRKSGLKNLSIGKNLHLHPVRMAWGYFPETGWPQGKSYEGGIMTSMSPIFDPAGYGTIIQTPSLHPGLFSVLMPWTSALDMKERMSRFSRTAHIFSLARDKGSGTVDFPGHLTYSLDPYDENNLRKGLEKVLKIMIAAGAEEVGTHHYSGERLKPKTSSPREVENFIERASSRSLRDLSTPLCSAHQMSSCRMGVDQDHSVVDPRGETWEVEGLFVADASVLPTALGVNPMITVQAVAYCIANFVLESLKISENN